MPDEAGKIWHRHIEGKTVKARRRAVAAALVDLRAELLEADDAATNGFLMQVNLTLIVGPMVKP